MFNRKCSVIGVIHVHSLPGSAGYAGDMRAIIDAAVTDAGSYVDGGAHALLIENMHDVPYLNGYVDPETTAGMTMVAQAIKSKFAALPLGIQILAGANIEALGVAVAAGLDFMRVEGFVFAHVGDEGLHNSCAPQLIRRRAALRANHIKIFADIKKKHSAHAITSDVSLTETAHAAEFFQADGVVVTGAATAIAPAAEDVAAVKGASACSVLVGSGITADNIVHFASHADALIVGSSLKHEGNWKNAVDKDRVKRLVATV
jgi:membrane complex biogenesis BtpA family protein